MAKRVVFFTGVVLVCGAGLLNPQAAPRVAYTAQHLSKAFDRNGVEVLSALDVEAQRSDGWHVAVRQRVGARDVNVRQILGPQGRR